MPLSLTKIERIEHLSLINHFTASGLAISQGHVLLVHHKRIGAWLPPGGHLHPGEMPHEAAIREVFEETGVAVEIISEPVPQTGSVEHLFLPQPLCIHAVQAVENRQTLYHLDMVFLCRLPGHSQSLPLLSTTEEVDGAQWVNLNGLTRLPLAANVIELITLARSKMNLDV
jgi:8-oxo-dGTP pyrophosphatase MutT (NUDIX family)